MSNKKCEPFQAFPNTQRDNGKEHGDSITNLSWERIESALGITQHDNYWRELYLALQESPLWPGTRDQNHAFVAEMFHLTALIHFSSVADSSKALQQTKSPEEAQRHFHSATIRLYSSLDIHCHLICCLNHENKQKVQNVLLKYWSSQASSRKGQESRFADLGTFFGKPPNPDLRSPDKLKTGLARVRNLSSVRDRLVHKTYLYFVNRRDRNGIYMLSPSLSDEEMVNARRTGVEEGWHAVEDGYYYCEKGKLISVRELLKNLVEESGEFIKASADWLTKHSQKWK